MRLLARTGIGIATSIILATTAALPGGAAAREPSMKDKRQLTVMTQNLYLGSSLDSAITATTPAAFVSAVATIYGTALATNFPRRAQVIADTIATERPDLIGLQEVTKWVAQPTVPGPNPPSTDFLAILQANLAARGLDYRVVVVSQNADIGPAPLVAPGFGCRAPSSAAWVPDCVVTLQDRDVILVNAETAGLEVLGSSTGDYVAQEVLTPPVGTPVSFARGWAYVDGTFQGKKFRFVTTHLEVESFAATQEAQAQEFLAGPARAPGAVIATGDFNSDAEPAATDTNTTTYADLTAHWFDDAWWVNPGDPGLTCCQNPTLSNPTSRLATRIDLVLTHGPVRTRSAHVVGDTRIPGATSLPLWASDHAGVVATLRLH